MDERLLGLAPEARGPRSTPERRPQRAVELPERRLRLPLGHGNEQHLRPRGPGAAAPYAYLDHARPGSAHRKVFLARKKTAAPTPA